MVNVVDCPEHIIVAMAVSKSALLTVTAIEDVSLHPLASVAITVYVVLAVGEATNDVPEPDAPAGELLQL